MPIKMKLNFPNQKPLLIAIMSLLAFACGGGGGGGSSTPAPSVPAPAPTPPFQTENSTLVVEVSSPATSALGAARDCNDLETDGSAAFSDITMTAGLCYPSSITPEDNTFSRITGGIAVSDYDADGRLDVYVTQGRNNPGRLFSQQPDNSFTETTSLAGVNTNSVGRGAAFIDINLDGRPDLVTIQEGPSFLQIFGNDGDGTFSDITDSTGINFTKGAFSAAAGDYDLDGDLDLIFGHWNNGEMQNRFEYLWQNQGDSTFVDVSTLVEIGQFTETTQGEGEQEKFEYSFTPIFADINNDRFPDLLMASDFTTSQVLINNPGMGLFDTTTTVISDRSGMGGTVADYDNDGDLDWFVSAAGDTREEFLTVSPLNGNRLYQNDGTGTFTDVTDVAGVRQGYWGWGTCFADFNNDGHLDIFIVNGFDGMTEEQSQSGQFAEYNADPARLFISNGNGTFTERAAELGVTHTDIGHGLACFDYDRDGDLDMLISNSGSAPSLYRNNSFTDGNNFLGIRLEGRTVNPQAVGARIYITVGGEERVAELQLGNNYLSQNPVEAHFGLGNAETVEQVRIVWPGLDAEVSELTDVLANQFLVIHQPDS